MAWDLLPNGNRPFVGCVQCIMGVSPPPPPKKENLLWRPTLLKSLPVSFSLRALAFIIFVFCVLSFVKDCSVLSNGSHGVPRGPKSDLCRHLQLNLHRIPILFRIVLFSPFF